MEDIIYGCPCVLSLEDVENVALSAGYPAEKVVTEDDVRVDIFIGKFLKWQWEKADTTAIWVLSQENPERAAEIAQRYLYIIRFAPSTISEVANFSKLFLVKYGGWIATFDDPGIFVTLDDILTLVRRYTTD